MAVNNSLANTKQAHPGQPAKTGITTFLNRPPGNNFHTSTSHTFRRPERSQPLFIISCANQEFSGL